MSNPNFENLVNLVASDISNCENNLYTANLNVVDVLTTLSSIHKNIPDVNYLKNFLNELCEKILKSHLFEGSNNIVNIINQSHNLIFTNEINDINDQIYIKINNSSKKYFKLLSQNNISNYLFFIIDSTGEIIFTNDSYNTEDEEITELGLDEIDLSEIISEKIKYYQITSLNTNYNLVIVYKC